MRPVELSDEDERTPGRWSLALILLIGLVIPLTMLAFFLLIDALFTHGVPVALLVALIFAVALAFILWVGYAISRTNR